MTPLCHFQKLRNSSSRSRRSSLARSRFRVSKMLALYLAGLENWSKILLTRSKKRQQETWRRIEAKSMLFLVSKKAWERNARRGHVGRTGNFKLLERGLPVS